MMNDSVRCGAVLALLLSTACTHSISPAAPTSTSPTSTNISPTSTNVTPATDSPRSFPPVSRPARIYVGVDSPASPRHGSPLASRYVLYDDGRFSLQYSSANYRFFEYRGTFTEVDSIVTFEWEAWSAAGPWGATGSLSDASLSVRYNIIMMLTDFEDGVFLRER